jgi:hypothetical protein
VLNYIKSVSASTGSTPYQVLNTNCTTVCRDALKAIGILPRNAGSIAPISLWTILYERYGNQSLITHPEVPARYGETRPGPARIPSQQGTDYGSSSFGMSTLLSLRCFALPGRDRRTPQSGALPAVALLP